MAALFALYVGEFVAVGGCRLEFFGKTGVEIGDYLMPVGAALLNFIEVGLHLGRKAYVHYVVEVVHEHVGYLIGDLCGDHVFAVLFHIVPLCEHGDYAGVRRGPAYALLLHGLYERRVGIPCGRTGELLLLGKVGKVGLISLL